MKRIEMLENELNMLKKTNKDEELLKMKVIKQKTEYLIN